MSRQTFLLKVALFGLIVVGAPAAWSAKPVNLRHVSAAKMQFFSPLPTLSLLSRETDDNHVTHTRYQQTYKGYPVWGGDIVIHTPEQKAKTDHKLAATMNGIVYEALDADLKAQPKNIFSEDSKQQALQTAIQHAQYNAEYKGDIKESDISNMVYIDDANQAHWTYLVTLKNATAQGIPARPVYIIDAINFTVYEDWNDIKTLDSVNGGGYGGNIKIGKILYDNLLNDYPELDIRRDPASSICYLKNADVLVKDRRFGDEIVHFTCEATNADHNNVYWDADADAVNGGYSPSNDALYLGKVIKDLYQAWYHIPVLTLNGKPMVLTMRVHETDTDGLPLDNAYWDNGQMSFGDGATLFYPLTTLGVTAHEIAHGFTEQHSNLKYKRQSGGLNESFSDMAAQAAEYYVTQQNTWTIGADVMKADNEAIRYMDDPTKDCKGRTAGNHCSIGNVDQYFNGMNVHNSSGVFNKVFYLISTSPGWDTRKAFNVMVQANRFHWTSNASFDDAACSVIVATQDLGYNSTAVVAAFAKVNIDTNDC